MSTLTAVPTSSRTPWTVHVVGILTLLLATVTSYGAIYFSFFFENPSPGLGSWVFVVVFLGMNAVAVASAIALWRGRRTGQQVLVAYGVVGILWCIAKLVFWSETESLVFGVANVLTLAMLLTPRTREYAVRSGR